MGTKPQKHKGQQEHETAFLHGNNQITDEVDIDPKLLALLIRFAHPEKTPSPS